MGTEPYIWKLACKYEIQNQETHNIIIPGDHKTKNAWFHSTASKFTISSFEKWINPWWFEARI